MRRLTFLLILTFVAALCAAAQNKQNAHKSGKRKTNSIPAVSLSVSANEVRLPAECRPGAFPKTPDSSSGSQVRLTTSGGDADGDELTYSYKTSAGKVSGSGPDAVWDLAGLEPGVYRANVFVSDGRGAEICDWVRVTVTAGECVPCGFVKIDKPSISDVRAGQTVRLDASAQQPGGGPLAYEWTVSAGRIVSGQGTSSVTIDTSAAAGQNLAASVRVDGLGAACPNTDQLAFNVIPKPEPPPVIPQPALFDSFAFTNMDDAKARLDAFAVQLQQRPDANAYLVVSGSCAGEAAKLIPRFRDYLLNQRGLDTARLQVIEGGCRQQLQAELWVVPIGAQPPSVTPSACQPCRQR